MKKLLSVLLAACLCCGMLAGCSGKQKDTSGENTEEQKVEEEKTLTADFNSDTNQKKKLEDYSFEVPKEWEEGANSAKNTLYFYPNQGMLMVMYSESEVSILNDIDRESFVNGMASGFEAFEMISETEVTVDDKPAYQFEMNARLAENDYSITMITFDIDSGLMSFMMGTLQSANEDYSVDFEKVIDSISFIGAENITDKPDRGSDNSSQEDAVDAMSYSGGMYKIGTDMPAGEYLITSTGGYYEVTTDSTGSLESIVTNDNYTNRAYVTVQDGQYFTFDGTAIPANEALAFSTSDGIYPEGMYLVGKDIPAGEYKISSNGRGYYEVTSDSVGELNSIVTNENFEGDVYLTISEGQYLKLSRAQIITN